MSYITIKEQAVDSFIEKKSRFIGTIMPAATEEEAAAFIRAQKDKYWDATHNVSAWLLTNGQKRYSDDGEPQGTAGMPVLEVIEREGLSNICIVVTRYFGGVLLGGGGLVRAYSHAAKIAVDAAQRLEMTECQVLSVTIDYSLYGKLQYLLPEYGIKVLDSAFGVSVVLTLLIRKERYPSFQKMFMECTNGAGILEIVEERFDSI